MVFSGKGILMLILSRREGQYIDIVNKNTGETITVLNSRYSASSMRIGIEASGDWDIVRREINGSSSKNSRPNPKPEPMPVLKVGDFVQSDIG